LEKPEWQWWIYKIRINLVENVVERQYFDQVQSDFLWKKCRANVRF